jgi:hypothetical protein
MEDVSRCCDAVANCFLCCDTVAQASTTTRCRCPRVPTISWVPRNSGILQVCRVTTRVLVSSGRSPHVSSLVRVAPHTLSRHSFTRRLACPCPCTHTNTHTYPPTHMHTLATYTHTHTHIYTHIYTHIHTHTQHIYTHIHSHTHTYTLTNTHTHSHTPRETPKNTRPHHTRHRITLGEPHCTHTLSFTLYTCK